MRAVIKAGLLQAAIAAPCSLTPRDTSLGGIRTPGVMAIAAAECKPPARPAFLTSPPWCPGLRAGSLVKLAVLTNLGGQRPVRGGGFTPTLRDSGWTIAIARGRMQCSRPVIDKTC